VPAGAATVSATLEARRVQRRLLDWLLNDAYPLWSVAGVDPIGGGFVESIGQDGRPRPDPRRARVQARQVYSFAQAPQLGWHGPGREIAERGLRQFIDKYRRPDGLFRTLVGVDGAPLDESALLYDQAFALLAFAAAHKVAGAAAGWERGADDLRGALNRHLKRRDSGFESALGLRLPLLSNPHMHLLEASLAWRELSANPVWASLANDIGSLALARFIDSVSGVVREAFDGSWSPVPGIPGRLVEPGHQFEWAWLLMRWGGEGSAQAAQTMQAARTLIEIGERSGVHAGVAVDALLDDFSIYEGGARLWPQTERLKASALAAVVTGADHHWVGAAAAGAALLRYLTTLTPGLWRDRLGAQGDFLVGPAPASNFYHLVAGIDALTRALTGDQR
jgi:mannose/cellobiose epimerase-like protein (N-acyl-D-glucosamine 2-epimerase family)